VCVGCEIDLFNCSSEEAIKAFSQILIIGIYGSRELVTKLKKCGFKTKILERHYYLFPKNKKRRVIFSVILAEKSIVSMR